MNLSQSIRPSKKEDRNGKIWEEGTGKRFSALFVISIIDIAARYALLTFLPFLLLQKGIPLSRVGSALTRLFAVGATGKLVCGILAEWAGIIPMVVGTGSTMRCLLVRDPFHPSFSAILQIT